MNYRKQTIFFLSVIIFSLISIVSLIFFILIKINSEQKINTNLIKEKEDPLILENIEPEFIYFSQLTGEGVENEFLEKPQTVAVMINNNPDGFPLFGINEAAIIYEVPVEGVFTRLMAIYPSYSAVEQVGPVRSARTYYLDWLKEYGQALYMHCGGSSDSLKEIKKQNIFDADEFSKTPFYWRDRTKIAPHNLFTSSIKWNEFIEKYPNEFKDWQGWSFGELAEEFKEELLTASYSYGKNFIVSWIFDEELNKYKRLLNNKNFLDADNQIITADNVIFQFSSIKVIDDLGRRNIETVGTGEVIILRDGIIIKGFWKKENEFDRTRFFDENDNEINLKSGKTWLMIVSKNTSLLVD